VRGTEIVRFSKNKTGITMVCCSMTAKQPGLEASPGNGAVASALRVSSPFDSFGGSSLGLTGLNVSEDNRRLMVISRIAL
jgi:hypothetical protein